MRRDPSRFLQVGFVALFVVLFILASYWIYDHINYTQSVRTELSALYDSQSDSSALAALHRDTNARINRIYWEGGFFLLVLLSGLVVLTRTIRHDAELRQRQQNFLAAVSHEFKSPLASIRLAAETLAMRSAEPETTRIAERILTDDERLLRMVENLLDTTRLEEGRHPLAPESTTLNPLISNIIDAAHARANTAGITISTQIPEAFQLLTDRAAFESIMTNLIDNSINACIAGNGSHITIQAEQSDAGPCISVTDDGVGFPESDGQMIFEKFYRSGNELRRDTPGTGLGLYIVRRLAELSGAQISAHSDGAGRGAKFTLQWPGGGA